MLRVHALWSLFAGIIATHSVAENAGVLGVLMNQNRRHELFDMAKGMGVHMYRMDRWTRIDAQARKVHSVRLWSGTEWVRASDQPLPDVVYDFSYFRSDRTGMREMRNLERQLKKLRIPSFVPRSTILTIRNKLLFAKMAQKRGLQHPLTLSESRIHLQQLLSKYHSVYIKPVWGNHGFGIIVVERTDAGFRLQYSVPDPQVKDSLIKRQVDVGSLEEVLTACHVAKKDMGTHEKEYFLQQGVDFYRFKDKQTYFRVFTQRGRSGKLVLGPQIAKVGGSLALGGFAAYPGRVLREMGVDVAATMRQIKQLALSAHWALEREHRARIAELGMDIGVRPDGEAFILEANDKPGYFRPAENRHQLETAFNNRRNRLNLEWARYLRSTKKPKGSAM